MKKLFCIVLAVLMALLTACVAKTPTNSEASKVSKIAATYVEVYANNGEKLMHIENTEKLVKFADIINNYKDYDKTVDTNKPDYIVKMGPTDNKNGNQEIKFWIKDDSIIFIYPQLADEPSKLSISTHPSSDFQKILDKN